MTATVERADNLSLFNTLLVLLLPWSALYILWTLLRTRRLPSTSDDKHKLAKTIPGVYEDIVPLKDFQWQTTEPLKLRPFKSQYHLTMGLENLAISDLVAVDKTYLDRVQLRRKYLNENTHATLALNPVCDAAIEEFHQWMFGLYLPQRFPTMFEKFVSSDRTEKTIPAKTKNLITDEIITVDEADPTSALHNLGSHVDTDFLFLLPSSSKDGQPIYHLEAFVTCFPSGFSSRSKMSMPLAEIHKPVPGYPAKLERSMDRYFAKIPVGTVVRRANWTVTTTDALFIEAGTHFYSGGTADADEAALQAMLDQQRKDIDIEKCRLRAERQTLHRLPRSKALVFAFKTYQYRLDDVKADGDGLALADAIDGLARGSVPEMHFYKRGIVWGELIANYLRAS